MIVYINVITVKQNHADPPYAFRIARAIRVQHRAIHQTYNIQRSAEPVCRNQCQTGAQQRIHVLFFFPPATTLSDIYLRSNIRLLSILLTRLPWLLLENEATLSCMTLVSKDCRIAISNDCDEEWKQIVFRKWEAEPLCLRQNKNENWHQVFQRNMHREIKAALRAKKTHEFWDKQFTASQTEWLAPYDDFRSLLLEQLGSNMDCNILIVGCGTSHVAERLWSDGYKNVTSTDISGMSSHTWHRPRPTAERPCPFLSFIISKTWQLST